jgi:hypothetical protein
MCLCFGAELERSQSPIDEPQAGNLLIAQFAAVEDEGQPVIPKP